MLKCHISPRTQWTQALYFHRGRWVLHRPSLLILFYLSLLFYFFAFSFVRHILTAGASGQQKGRDKEPASFWLLARRRSLTTTRTSDLADAAPCCRSRTSLFFRPGFHDQATQSRLPSFHRLVSLFLCRTSKGRLPCPRSEDFKTIGTQIGPYQLSPNKSKGLSGLA